MLLFILRQDVSLTWFSPTEGKRPIAEMVSRWWCIGACSWWRVRRNSLISLLSFHNKNFPKWLGFFDYFLCKCPGGFLFPKEMILKPCQRSLWVEMRTGPLWLGNSLTSANISLLQWKFNLQCMIHKGHPSALESHLCQSMERLDISKLAPPTEFVDFCWDLDFEGISLAYHSAAKEV